MITRAQVESVNARVLELLGPFDFVTYCPHGPDDGCSCRKPKPGMLLDAARALAVRANACAMVGDKADDVEAAKAAGMHALRVAPERGLKEAMPELRRLYGEGIIRAGGS